MGVGGRFSLGDFRLRLDPQIEAEIQKIQSGSTSPLLRRRLLQPDWSRFQQSQLDWVLRQPVPKAPGPPVPRLPGPPVPRPPGPPVPRLPMPPLP